MCGECGCDASGPAALNPPASRTVQVEQSLLGRNDRLAAGNRAWLARRGVLALNLLSGPGAGKTTLLERTIRARPGGREVCVIEGDQETDHDAQRIREAGARAVQINTGTGCHLDAGMVARGMAVLDPRPGELLLIENVGNLVCPAMFDLGEAQRVVVASVTDGEEKPLKYPHVFRGAGLVLLNKVDLLPHLGFDLARFREALRRVNASAPLLAVSATRGDGFAAWLEWLETQAARSQRLAGAAP